MANVWLWLSIIGGIICLTVPLCVVISYLLGRASEKIDAIIRGEPTGREDRVRPTPSGESGDQHSRGV